MVFQRKPTPPAPLARDGHAGVDVTSSRIAAVSLAGGRIRPLMLEGESAVLPLFVSAEGRALAIGRTGLGVVRRRPHLAHGNFLTALGTAKAWRGGRHALTPDAAITLAIEAIAPAIRQQASSCVVTLPTFLSNTQVARFADLAQRANLPIAGTIAAPLAIAADRTAAIHDHDAPAGDAGSVVKSMRTQRGGPAQVLVIDVDEHGMSAALVAIDASHIEQRAAAIWERTSERAWFSRLIDGISDRCVRLCRRDPRDSAEAEQDLFEQLIAILERGLGDSIHLTLRTAQWVQEMVLKPEDFEDLCANLIESATQQVHEFLAGILPVHPPGWLWLTHEAARLPGLAKHLHGSLGRLSTLECLPADAKSAAAARLAAQGYHGHSPGALLRPSDFASP